jgi:hypothetical protein
MGEGIEEVGGALSLSPSHRSEIVNGMPKSREQLP